jgi:hypothetical protein
VYPDPRRDEWQTKILPALKKIPLQLLVKLSGMSRSTLIEVRAARQQAASQEPGVTRVDRPKTEPNLECWQAPYAVDIRAGNGIRRGLVQLVGFSPRNQTVISSLCGIR